MSWFSAFAFCSFLIPQEKEVWQVLIKPKGMIIGSIYDEPYVAVIA